MPGSKYQDFSLLPDLTLCHMGGKLQYGNLWFKNQDFFVHTRMSLCYLHLQSNISVTWINIPGHHCVTEICKLMQTFRIMVSVNMKQVISSLVQHSVTVRNQSILMKGVELAASDQSHKEEPCRATDFVPAERLFSDKMNNSNTISTGIFQTRGSTNSWVSLEFWPLSQVTLKCNSELTVGLELWYYHSL